MNALKENFLVWCSEMFEHKFSSITVSELNTDRLLYVNETFEKMFAVTWEQALGKSPTELGLMSEKTRAKLKVMLLIDGNLNGWPMQMRSTDGIVRDVLLTTEIIQQSGSSCLLSRMVDVTDMRLPNDTITHREAFQYTRGLLEANKALAFQNDEKGKRIVELRSSNYARGLIEASLDPLVTINATGKITDSNQAMINITGMAREVLIDSNFFDYTTEREKAGEVYREVFEKGSVADYPLVLRHKDGRLSNVLVNGAVYKDELGHVNGAMIVARDVTEQNRIQRELSEAIVFAELAAVTAEKAKERAEQATITATNAVKAKQQFLANMSHEIRTPMNAIIGFTKVLLKTELSTKQNEYLSAIKISGDALIVLINDILDLAKVDAGKMTFEQAPFKLVASISAMLHLFEAKIQEKNLSLEVAYDPQIPEVLLGDAARLHQIIMNLVSNAVKFTHEGKIQVEARLLQQDDAQATIEVSVMDTGIGISETKLETIFENFQQASSSTSRLFGGTGLGLAIVKQLVEQQGGKISVTSKLDEGSTFSFSLPFGKTDAEPEAIVEFSEPDDADLKNIRVLVAEDMPLNQLLMRTLLDDFGFDKDIVSNGQIAVEKLQNQSYDIILMDLQMPVMNGFEATEYIRNTLHSTIPIIALTADVTTADLAKCTQVGMNDYLAKPVNERLLYSKITSLVKKPIEASSNEEATPKQRYVDLAYLMTRTKANPDLMMEMISLYIKQTPLLVNAMRQSLEDQDWQTLYSAAHKMIPSFSIMGINPEFETMAKKVQEFASAQQQSAGIHELVAQLGHVCAQACEELEEELTRIRTAK